MFTNSSTHNARKLLFAIPILLLMLIFVCPIKAFAAGSSETLTYANNEWRILDSAGRTQNITTIARNSDGWWYVKNGILDRSYNGFARRVSDNTWWYVKKGKVQNKSTGLGSGTVNNTKGSWYVVNGKVRFITTIYKNSSDVRYYIENGLWQKSFTGYAGSLNNRWYFVNGKATVHAPVKTTAFTSSEDLAGTSGAYGSLSIPSLNFSVPLYAASASSAQSVVDAENSAAYITYWSKIPAIADHNVQGFRVLESVKAGSTRALVVKKDGTYHTYICDARYEGKRVAGNLYDTQNNDIQNRYSTGLLMYTCKTYPYVTITHWEAVD